ncbi:MAG: hypothetical protein HY811_00730 [Planctomycetes bacterium]|nr:hypothetical protein [Planctomycetota bacterium]
MSKPSIIGIKYAAIGILGACIIFAITTLLLKIIPSASVGLASLTGGGIISAMAIAISHKDYKRGGKTNKDNVHQV